MIGVCDCARTLRHRREAVLAGQHDVEDQEIDAAVGHGAGHLAAVGRGRHVAGVVAQVFCDQRPRLAIVLNDEDVGYCLGHADLLSVIRARARRIFVSGCFWMYSGQHRATGEGAGEKTSLRPVTLRSCVSRVLDEHLSRNPWSYHDLDLGGLRQTYQSPLQKLQDELLSEVNSGAISSSDQDALSSALTDIDSSLQSSRASDQASGTQTLARRSEVEDRRPDRRRSFQRQADQRSGHRTAGRLQGRLRQRPRRRWRSPGGPGGAGGPPPGGPPPSDDASSSDDTSSSSSTSIDDILKQFLQSLQESLSASSSTSYGATGTTSSSSSASFSALLIDYQS